MFPANKILATTSFILLIGPGLVFAVTPESEPEAVMLSADNLPRGLEVDVVDESCSGCHQIDVSLSSVQASGEWVAVAEQTAKATCGREKVSAE